MTDRGEVPKTLPDRDFESFGVDIVLHQEGGLHGGHVWDAALVLSKYFENVDDFPIHHFRGKRVLELGCGTGLVGLVLARLDADVTLTDLPAVLELTKRNVADNAAHCKIRCLPFVWGESNSDAALVAEIAPPFDVVVLSDPVYMRSQVEPLVDTLLQMTSFTSTVYVAQELRNSGEVEFFRHAANFFECYGVPNTRLHDQFQADEILVVRLVRKSQDEIDDTRARLAAERAGVLEEPAAAGDADEADDAVDEARQAADAAPVQSLADEA